MSAPVDPLEEKLDAAVQRLEQARPFAKEIFQRPVIDLARRMLSQPGGLQRLYERAPRLDRAGIFAGTDWDEPGTLLPGLVPHTLDEEDPATVALECLSELRLLAVANRRFSYPGLSAEQAEHFLTQVLALNLSRLFGARGESDRIRLGPLGTALGELFRYLLEHIGFKDILGSLIEEIWRILEQRPIQVTNVREMVTQIDLALARGVGDIGEARVDADALISALYGPTHASLGDPGLDAYRSSLATMDLPGLQQEAHGFARSMHHVGLVSEYHAVFLRWLLENERAELIPLALGLSSTGVDVMLCYLDLVHRLIRDAIHPETAQAVYGLAMLLERGILHWPPVAPGLWRQIVLTPSAATSETLSTVFGESHPPRVHLLAGVLSLLGQPLGVAQGNNPTCQSARALSMWSYSDPGYLLHLIAHAARFDRILMDFEGGAIVSSDLAAGMVRAVPRDMDPVSTLLVPHLDRVYAEMGRRCVGRAGDPHRWINPELHGWWVGREMTIAVAVDSGNLADYETFLRRFYASYHPFYNGHQPIIHPQPAGLAVTDSSAEFVGWHAITLIRVALDQENVMRVYFFNPNNDSGQNWGNGVVVSTHGHGERHGEASLPFPELASRLYLFHDDPGDRPQDPRIPREEIEAVRAMAVESWAAKRQNDQ